MSRIMATAKELVVGRRRYSVSRSTTVDAEARQPHLMRRIVLALVGLIGVPFAILLNQGTPQDLSWTVVLPMTVAAVAAVFMLAATTKYCVVLRTGEQQEFLFMTRDHLAVIILVVRSFARALGQLQSRG
jgi:hypothetical protein